MNLLGIPVRLDPSMPPNEVRLASLRCPTCRTPITFREFGRGFCPACCVSLLPPVTVRGILRADLS